MDDEEREARDRRDHHRADLLIVVAWALLAVCAGLCAMALLVR